MKKIPKKEYKLEYTDLFGNTMTAYLCARSGQLAVDKLTELYGAKNARVVAELPFDQAAYLAA